jgi:hypothetical protein
VPTYGSALAEWNTAAAVATVLPMPGVRVAAAPDEPQARRTSAAMRSTSSSGSSG